MPAGGLQPLQTSQRAGCSSWHGGCLLWRPPSTMPALKTSVWVGVWGLCLACKDMVVVDHGVVVRAKTGHSCSCPCSELAGLRGRSLCGTRPTVRVRSTRLLTGSRRQLATPNAPSTFRGPAPAHSPAPELPLSAHSCTRPLRSPPRAPQCRSRSCPRLRSRCRDGSSPLVSSRVSTAASCPRVVAPRLLTDSSCFFCPCAHSCVRVAAGVVGGAAVVAGEGAGGASPALPEGWFALCPGAGGVPGPDAAEG